MPYEPPRALSFCAHLKKHFNIPDENVLHVGDEVDNLHGGMYPKDPDGHHTPNSEIKAAREKIKEWASEFPIMRLAISNHGVRWAKKAALAEIPSQMMRAYQDVLQMPEGWRWAEKWIIETKHPFMIKHGMDLGGKTPYRQAAELGVMSTAFGHLHSSAGLCWVKTKDKNVWAMNVGSLIDPDSYAFKYGKDNKFQPNLGCGVVLNQGGHPVWIPLDA